MVSIRPALALALCAGVMAGGAAVAAPKPPAAQPVCNQIVDPAGDAKGLLITDPGPMPSSETNLDVVTADFGSDAKTLTAAVRLTALDASDSSSPGGRTYYAYFTVGDVEMYMSAKRDAAGADTFTVGYVDGTRKKLADATGVFDLAKKEVRISAPLSAFADKAKLTPGTKVSTLHVLTQRVAGVFTLSADEATSDKTYTLGAPSCVPIGK